YVGALGQGARSRPRAHLAAPGYRGVRPREVQATRLVGANSHRGLRAHQGPARDRTAPRRLVRRHQEQDVRRAARPAVPGLQRRAHPGPVAARRGSDSQNRDPRQINADHFAGPHVRRSGLREPRGREAPGAAPAREVRRSGRGDAREAILGRTAERTGGGVGGRLDAAMLHFLWNIDPVLLQLGPLELRWYGLLFAGGILAAYAAGARSFERAGGSREEANRLLVYVVVGTVVGARLGHCLLYEPAYYLSHPLEILAVWRGGLASHGGAVGIVVAVWLYARRAGQDLLWLLDRVAVAAPVAAASIRVGNFFNSEIVGRPSTVPWAVVFHLVDALPRHPAMLYEAAAYLVTFMVMLTLD